MTGLPSAHWPADRSSVILDMTVGELLREAAADACEATALVEGAARPADRRRWTYAELLEQAERTARALLGRFEPGERVAVWANNIPEWVLLELAAGLAGITLVTVNPALRAEELTHVLGQSQANGIFLVPQYRGTSMADLLDAVRGGLPRLREVVLFSDWEEFGASGSPTQRLPQVGPADSAQVQYTSGTTGLPKGAVLHHRGIVNNARLTVERLGVIGVPDPVWGEQVAAFIRAAPGRTPDPGVLFAYCRERLAAHKTPRHWRIVDAFPLTPSGKVQKYILREQLLADLGTGAPVSGPDVPAAAPPG